MTDLQSMFRELDQLNPDELGQARQYIEQRRRTFQQLPFGQFNSARDLLTMPQEERDRILQTAATGAESIYRTNPDLTDFEAFSESDFYDETA